MPCIRAVTLIAAPAERVFDLVRSVELHADSMSHTGARAVAGVTSGLAELGDEVTWSARHFGIRQRLTTRVTVFERPRRFRESMTRGAFRRFDHDHFFEPEDPHTTRLTDVFEFESPLGPLGRLVDWLAIERHMRGLVIHRSAAIKKVAESDDWRKYLPARL